MAAVVAVTHGICWAGVPLPCPLWSSNATAISLIDPSCFALATGADLSRLAGEACEGLRGSQVAQVDWQKCSFWGSSCGAFFSRDALSGLTSACVGGLSASFVSVLSEEQVSWIPFAAMRGLGGNARYMEQSCAGITPLQAQLLREFACVALRKGCAVATREASLAVLAPDCLSQLLPEFCGALSQEQMLAFRDDAFDGLSQSCLSGVVNCSSLSGERLSFVSSCLSLRGPCAATMPVSSFASLKFGCATQLSREFVAALSPEKVSMIPREAFSGFGVDTVRGFGSLCAEFSKEQFSGFSLAVACRGFTALCLASLSTEAWNLINPSCAAVLNAGQVDRNVAVRLAYLSPEAIGALAGSVFVQALRVAPELVTSFTADQLDRCLALNGSVADVIRNVIDGVFTTNYTVCPLSSETISHLTWLQLALSPDDSTACWDSSLLFLIRRRTFSGLRPGHLRHLSPGLSRLVIEEAVTLLSPLTLGALTASDVSLMSQAVFEDLVPVLGFLSAAAVAGVTEAQATRCDPNVAWPCSAIAQLSPRVKKAFLHGNCSLLWREQYLNDPSCHAGLSSSASRDRRRFSFGTYMICFWILALALGFAAVSLVCIISAIHSCVASAWRRRKRKRNTRSPIPPLSF